MKGRSGQSRRVQDVGEFGLIRDWARILSKKKDVPLGIGDDAAVIRSPSGDLMLITADMLVEKVHFRSGAPARQIGHKALACSLSDIAAMGGVPGWAVVSLGAPKTATAAWCRSFYRGLSRLADDFDVSVVGGDTVQSSRIVVNVTLFGHCPEGRFVTRSGARPGDLIFVTGPLGRAWKTTKHLSFTPRLKESRYLMTRIQDPPTSMIDISDGTAADLRHILQQSGCGAELWEDSLPLRKGASLEEALFDGEDFELLFTLAPETGERLAGRIAEGMTFRRIGRVTADQGRIELITSNGRKRVPGRGYQHF